MRTVAQAVVLPIQKLRAVLQMIVMDHIRDERHKKRKHECRGNKLPGYHGRHCANEFHQRKRKRDQKMNEPLMLKERNLHQMIPQSRFPIRLVTVLAQQRVDIREVFS